jgi:two-component system, OmpR family, aerobic respiration control sensor histidine kinase ArcB
MENCQSFALKEQLSEQVIIKSEVAKPLQDIIEQQKTEIFQLRSVIENLPGSIYWKDRDGFYLGRNTYSMEKMQSADLEDNKVKDAVVGKTDYSFFSKEIADSYRKHDLKVMTTKKELSIEEPITLPNGQTIVQLSIKKPLYNEKGEVAGVIGNTVDITYLKKIEDELRQAKEKAEQANIIKTEFMRNMEHDIRTPFSGVLGLSSCLLEIEQDVTKKKYLNDIAQCAKELLDYCNNVLDFSKIESGMLTIIDKKFSLEKLVDSVTKLELPASIHKNLELKIKYDTNIPDLLIGDSYRVHCILINLLSNAIKFTQDGYVELSVSLIKKTNKSALLRFIIKDTGIGIPGDKQEYIFEKFSRLSLSNKGFYKGIGLGLRIVKQFIHELDGEIDLMSELGEGTQFICTVPFKLPLT